MTPHRIARLTQTLGLVGRTRVSIPFFFSAESNDGLPELLVAPKALDSAEISRITHGATSPLFVRGTISRDPDEGVFVFHVEAGDPKPLIAELQDRLDHQAPGLKYSKVTTAA